MATNLPSCFLIQFLEQLLKFLVNFTLLKYVKSQRSYGFLITKELIFGFQILDLKDHFSASLTHEFQNTYTSTLKVVDSCWISSTEWSDTFRYFLYTERSKNQEKKYIITVQKDFTFLRRFDHKKKVLGISRNLIDKFVFKWL